MKNIIKVFFVLLLIPSAFGGYQLALETSYIKRNSSFTIGSSETKYEETRNPLEIKFGHVFGNKMYVGAIYNMGSRTVVSSSSSNTEKESGLGLSVGYDMANHYIHLSYYLSGQYDVGNNMVFKEASGFQLDFGWKIKWLSSISVIPQISYRSISYKKRDSNGTEVDVDSSDFGGLIPEIGLMYEF